LSLVANANQKVGVFLSIPASFQRKAGREEFGPAIRQAVVDRWRDCGFDVFSVNSAEEAKALASLVERVEIISSEDQGRVRISSICNIARQKNFDVIIISNADCLPIDAAILQSLVAKVGLQDVCIGERMNINAATLIPTGRLCTGFDTFIFGAGALNNIPAVTEWRIGDPIWDYWFPWVQKKMGARVFNAGVPVTIHMDHPQAWNFKMWRPKLQAFFDEMPIGSAIFPQSFKKRFGKTNIANAFFITKLNVSMALYTSLLELPHLLPTPAEDSFENLQIGMFNASAKQGWFSRVAIILGGFFK
jgi:hypothetical protein